MHLVRRSPHPPCVGLVSSGAWRAPPRPHLPRQLRDSMVAGRGPRGCNPLEQGQRRRKGLLPPPRAAAVSISADMERLGASPGCCNGVSSSEGSPPFPPPIHKEGAEWAEEVTALAPPPPHPSLSRSSVWKSRRQPARALWGGLRGRRGGGVGSTDGKVKGGAGGGGCPQPGPAWGASACPRVSGRAELAWPGLAWPLGPRAL